ncbi:polysaccharide pyruvyl transferase family protein [Paenibacillus sp. Marseille-Q7038]
MSFTTSASPMETNTSNLYTLGVGVPFTFDESFGKFIKNSFKRFNMISVRDMRSANILNENGIDNVIVPDIILSISRYFSKERLTHSFRKIRDTLSIQENSYMIFQANENVIRDEELVSLSEFLNGLSTNLKIPIVMLSIGECLGDNELYTKLKPLVKDLIFINRDSIVGMTIIESCGLGKFRRIYWIKSSW